MSYDLLAVLAGLLAISAQFFDVRTTRKMQHVLSGIPEIRFVEKTDFVRWLQKSMGSGLWGPITLGVVLVAVAVPWFIWGPQATIVISAPLIGFSIFHALRNRRKTKDYLTRDK